MAKIYIIYYSMYGHIKTMAEAVKKAIDSVDGCEGVIYQVAETLPAEVLGKMHAPPKSDYPIVDAHTINQADGFVFGFPTRFGMPAAQFKAFMDATGSHWFSGALAGKPVSFFTSSGMQGGGQETTILTALPFVAHHGMIFVPGKGVDGLASNDAARGGSPWGPGTLSGKDGSRQPSEVELAHATSTGKNLATIAKKLIA